MNGHKLAVEAITRRFGRCAFGSLGEAKYWCEDFSIAIPERFNATSWWAHFSDRRVLDKSGRGPTPDAALDEMIADALDGIAATRAAIHKRLEQLDRIEAALIKAQAKPTPHPAPAVPAETETP